MKIEMKAGDSASLTSLHAVLTFASGLMTLVLFLGGASMSIAAAADCSQAKQMNQVIIKFRDPARDPSQQGDLNELARDIGVTLIYLRPMSGGAHVLRVEGAVDAEQFQRIVNELAARPEVEYAEPDRLLHHMPQR